MSDNSGQYKSEIFQVGELRGPTELFQGSRFKHPALVPGGPEGALDFNPGAGNRVNLLIGDFISDETRESAGLLEFGIYVTWSFFGLVAGEGVKETGLGSAISGSTTYRILSNERDSDIVPGDIRSRWFQDIKVDYEDSSRSVSNPEDLQLGELRYNYYTFPIDNSFFGFIPPFPQPADGATDCNGYRILPLVARGDFMRVFFHFQRDLTFPGFIEGDNVILYAMRGQDAPGSQKL